MFNEASTVTNNGKLNTYTFSDNGSFTFEFEDEAGNTQSKTATVSWIDKTIPKATIVFQNAKGDILNSDTWSNTDITISIIPPANSTLTEAKFNDVLVDHSPLVTDLGNNQYTVSEYGILTYTIEDTETFITNTDQVLIRVDKTPPTVKNIVFSATTWTNQNVSATITGEDDLGTVSYPDDSSYTFTENGSYEFILEDNAGNRTLKTVTVDWIDKSTPIATVKYYVDNLEYDITKPINKNVVAKVTFNGGGSPVSVTNNSGSLQYEI